MITSRRLRAPAGLAAAVLLSACGGGDVEGSASPASPASGSPSESAGASESVSSGAPSSGTDLAPGLLPADAFGPGAQVTPIPEQQLEQSAAGASTEGLQVTPPECDQAVQGTQPSFDEYDDVAAQVAVLGTTTTVQALTSGGPAEDAVANFDDQLGACRSVQLTSPEVGTVTVAFDEIDVPDLGDGSAGISSTTTATGPDGQQVTVPALVGAVHDGERVVVLVTTDTGGGRLDPTAFTGLLREAYDTQAEALD
ncbi:hypothetical protein SAMN05660359_03260 [Geodermatophilus obscurus]|uniref:PknH-like extracellular domain-containing protein n=1 Tax=Geodermatophilus obscurus TaxID=1861 RepID=A0A1I5H077_9ACTN|nr:hypothetical protein [Geodermatophilus obscurus]SFO41652.1 hypothetical protein SAMN05660359_03260 [Geodermatophilus obscurus]